MVPKMFLCKCYHYLLFVPSTKFTSLITEISARMSDATRNVSVAQWLPRTPNTRKVLRSIPGGNTTFFPAKIFVSNQTKILNHILRYYGTISILIAEKRFKENFNILQS